MSEVVKLGDRFTWKCGTVTEVVDKFQKNQIRGWAIGENAGGYVRDFYHSSMVEEANYGRWEDNSWPVDGNRRLKPDGTYDILNQLVLCAVDELDPRENEFGTISP